MSIVNTRKIWFALSGTLAVLSLIALSVWGLRLGIDFTGGSLLEVGFLGEQQPQKGLIEGYVVDSGVETNIRIQQSDDNSYILRMRTLSEEDHQAILKTFTDNGYTIDEKRFDSVGPVIGQELKKKAIWSLIIVLFAIVFYIAWAFRKVSRTIPSWKYGVIALIALFHDVLITVGIFAVLGHYFGYEVGLPFVAALLTILGYSVNDTIVIFDRIRENLLKQSSSADFLNTVDKSINQNLSRSINTSFTTLLVLLAIYFFGGSTISDFILALIIGIVLGTYSSIFLASPLLVVVQRFGYKR